MEHKQEGTGSPVSKEQNNTEGPTEEQLHPSSSDIKLEILMWPDKRLKMIAVPFTEVDEHTTRYAKLLLDTMYAEGGIGIAGPQVSWGQRIIIVDTQQYDTGKKDPLVLLNPELSEMGGEQTIEESCLSVPMPPAPVKRFEEVVVNSKTLEWEDQQHYFYGFEAGVLQHEVDHLSGILYIDLISKLRRDMLIKKYRKAKKYGKISRFNRAAF